MTALPEEGRPTDPAIAAAQFVARSEATSIPALARVTLDGIGRFRSELGSSVDLTKLAVPSTEAAIETVELLEAVAPIVVGIIRRVPDIRLDWEGDAGTEEIPIRHMYFGLSDGISFGRGVRHGEGRVGTWFRTLSRHSTQNFVPVTKEWILQHQYDLFKKPVISGYSGIGSHSRETTLRELERQIGQFASRR